MTPLAVWGSPGRDRDARPAGSLRARAAGRRVRTEIYGHSRPLRAESVSVLSEPNGGVEDATRAGKKPGPEMEPRGAGIRRAGLELQPRLCPPRARDRRSAGAVPGAPGRAATSGRRGGWAGSSSTGMASVASPGRTSPGFSGVRAGSALGAGPGTWDPELKSRGQASRRSGAEGARRSAGTAGRAGKAVRAEGGGGPGSSPRKGGCFRVFPGRGKGRTQPRGQQGGLLGSAVWPRGEGAAGLKVGPSFGLKTKGALGQPGRRPGTHTGLGSGGPGPGMGGPCGG